LALQLTAVYVTGGVCRPKQLMPFLSADISPAQKGIEYIFHRIP
jgi:hypothetical protein